jgi:hypothetical protein
MVYNIHLGRMERMGVSDSEHKERVGAGQWVSAVAHVGHSSVCGVGFGIEEVEEGKKSAASPQRT